MAELFASGRVVDVIIALMAAEAIILIIIRNKVGVGIAPLDLLASLAAGVALLLALRAELQGFPWPRIAMWLIVALLAHGWDLTRRWTDRS